MPITTDRDTATLSATIPAGAALSNPIDFLPFAFAGLITPPAWTAAAIAFKVSTDRLTFFPLKSSTGALIELASPVVNEARPLPAELTAFPYFQLWSETAGADVAQAVAAPLTLVLKS